MRLSCVLLVLVCLLSVASAQWLETTIWMPDSFGGLLGGPQCLAYDSADDAVYVGGNGGSLVMAISGSSNQKIARIPVKSNVCAFCRNPQNDKVYCACPDSHCVTILDGATNVVDTAPVTGYYPDALCYNPQNNAVYCANGHGSSVCVIDGATNRVLTLFGVGTSPRALCYNPQDNKVYCANEEDLNVTVIDGATNRVITNATTGHGTTALCYNPTDDEVYCAECRDNAVAVMNGISNNVVHVSVGSYPCALTCNPGEDRVYVANRDGSSVSVIRDLVLGTRQVAEDKPAELGCLPAIIRGVLELPAATSCKPQTTSCLLDITGRSVMKLKPGPSDVSRLASGVYFMSLNALGRTETRKLIITR